MVMCGSLQLFVEMFHSFVVGVISPSLQREKHMLSMLLSILTPVILPATPTSCLTLQALRKMQKLALSSIPDPIRPTRQSPCPNKPIMWAINDNIKQHKHDTTAS